MAERHEEWIHGIPGSPGIAIGRVFLLDRRKLSVPHYHIEPTETGTELIRLQRAMQRAEDELLEVRDRIEADGKEEPLGILETGTHATSCGGSPST